MREENLDFKYILPENEPGVVQIQILNGEYEGVVYKYGKIKVEEKDDNAYLVFNYDIIDSPKIKAKKLEKDESFKNYIGDFLVEIISANIDQEYIDENRDNDI